MEVLQHTSRSNKNKKNNSQRHDILGIHHVTAIASNPQKNIDFYTQILGLRLVSNPTTYHLYFGDEIGRPGTIITFFHGQMPLTIVGGQDKSLLHRF